MAMLDMARPTVTVQCAKLVRLDDEACGAMVHTVDKVLLPPGGGAVEIIKHHGRFAKFLSLIEFAELENQLSTEGPYTLLAPTDAAFENLVNFASLSASFFLPRIAINLLPRRNPRSPRSSSPTRMWLPWWFSTTLSASPSAAPASRARCPCSTCPAGGPWPATS